MINIAALKRAHNAFILDLVEEIDLAQEQAGDTLKVNLALHSEFNKPTGKLAAKTETRLIRTRNGNVLRVSNKAKYALAQERGSGTHAGKGPYPIRPRRARALRFMSGGAVVFSRGVMHPGVPATHWLMNGIKRGESAETNFLNARFSRIARTFSLKRV